MIITTRDTVIRYAGRPMDPTNGGSHRLPQRGGDGSSPACRMTTERSGSILKVATKATHIPHGRGGHRRGADSTEATSASTSMRSSLIQRDRGRQVLAFGRKPRSSPMGSETQDKLRRIRQLSTGERLFESVSALERITHQEPMVRSCGQHYPTCLRDIPDPVAIT